MVVISSTLAVGPDRATRSTPTASRSARPASVLASRLSPLRRRSRLVDRSGEGAAREKGSALLKLISRFAWKETFANPSLAPRGQERTFTPIVEFVYCRAIIAKSCRSRRLQDNRMAQQIAACTLFANEHLPVWRHRSGRPRHRLIQRMRVGRMKLWAGEDFVRPIVVKPMLPGLEACDDRVIRSGVMFRCMLIWRTVTAADVTALGASAKMQPPAALSHALDAACSARPGHRVDTIRLGCHTLLLGALSPTRMLMRPLLRDLTSPEFARSPQMLRRRLPLSRK